MANKTKAERRAEAREKARRLQELEAKRAKRNKLITILVIVVAIVLVGVAIWSIVSNGSKDDANGRPDYDPVAVQVEPVVKENTEITTGFAVIGENAELSADAPRVDIYFDYMCTYCNDLEQWNGADINDLVAEADAEFVYHPVAILNNDFSAKGAAAFKFIAENSPEHLAGFHKNVFEDTDAVLNGRSSTLPDWGNIRDAASDAGVPSDIVDRIEDEADLEWANTVTTEFLKEYRGTPTVLVNGEETTAWANNDFKAMLGLAEPKDSNQE